MPFWKKRWFPYAAAVAFLAAVVWYLNDPKDNFLKTMRVDHGGEYVTVHQYGSRFDTCGKVEAVHQDGSMFKGTICCNSQDNCTIDWGIF